MIDLSIPITAAELCSRAEGQILHDDASLWLRGFSISHPGNGIAQRAYEACQGFRHTHAALPRGVARKAARKLANIFISQDALTNLLCQESGLAQVGDLHLRFQLGTKLDALLDEANAATLAAREDVAQ